MIEGGCYCRKVRYAIEDGEYLSVNCHCTMCRRIHSAPYVTWLVVPVDRFRYVTAAPEVLHSSDKGTRYFCPRCGSHVACVVAAHAEFIDIPVGSLDRPEAAPPTMEVHDDTRLGWIPPLERA